MVLSQGSPLRVQNISPTRKPQTQMTGKTLPRDHRVLSTMLASPASSIEKAESIPSRISARKALGL